MRVQVAKINHFYKSTEARLIEYNVKKPPFITKP